MILHYFFTVEAFVVQSVLSSEMQPTEITLIGVLFLHLEEYKFRFYY